MYNNIKKHLRFISYLTYALFVIIVSCTKENNPVLPNKGDKVVPSPFDKDAPQIKEEWAKWIKLNSNEIKSLDSPNYSDLQFLGTLIQNKKIVQLGESSHGVKEFNKVKVRLIKYLHEKMGFNIIAFESPVFDCFYANSNAGKTSPTFMMKNSIYGVWYTEEVKELFTYIIQTQTTNNPLNLVGFDIQLNFIGSKYRPEFLKSIILKIAPEKANSIYTLDSYFLNISETDRKKITEQKDSLISRYQMYFDLLENNWGKLINSYLNNSPIPHIAKLTIRSIIKYINQIHYDNIGNRPAAYTERDINMAYNLEYLFNNVYSNEKIIVWAHNAHICYNNAKITPTYAERLNTMGYYLHTNLSNVLYTIGFYMYKGKVADNTRVALDVTTSTSENIEAILYSAGYYYSFVDMLNQGLPNDGNSWMFNKMKAKYWGINDQLLVPKEQYDALLYIYETSLPDYLKTSLMKSNNKNEVGLNDYR